MIFHWWHNVGCFTPIYRIWKVAWNFGSLRCCTPCEYWAVWKENGGKLIKNSSPTKKEVEIKPVWPFIAIQFRELFRSAISIFIGGQCKCQWILARLWVIFIMSVLLIVFFNYIQILQEDLRSEALVGQTILLFVLELGKLISIWGFIIWIWIRKLTAKLLNLAAFNLALDVDAEAENAETQATVKSSNNIGNFIFQSTIRITSVPLKNLNVNVALNDNSQSLYMTRHRCFEISSLICWRI